MQGYRTAKPHAGTPCPECAPTAAGHALCQYDGCDEAATAQTRRHATDAEYAAIPANFKPIDGVAHMTVYGCDDHPEDGFQSPCTHPAPAPVKCPKCGANGDAPCTLKNGDARWAWHTARAQAQPAAERCTHAHRADCPVFDGCQCTSADTPPTRAARTPADAPGPDTSGLTVPLRIAQMILANAGIPWITVARARSLLTQDNKAAVAAETYVLDANGHRTFDEHGHPVTRETIVPIPLQPAANS